jgi:hypothetical protein
MSALVVVVVSVALVTAGCGTESPSRDDPTAKATQVTAGGPSEPPPKLDIDGPPPAWVHTGDDAVWLAYSTYCWKTACADYVETRCGERRIPTVVVQPGETVLFHLDFNPKSVSLVLDGPENHSEGVGAAHAPLAAARTVEWKAYRDGPVTLVAIPSGSGDASYVVCFRFAPGSESTLAAPPPFLSVAEALQTAEGARVLVQGALVIENGQARLCSRLAESNPPQCAHPSLAVIGLDRAFVRSLSAAGGVRWSETPVDVTGNLAAGVLSAHDP